ncbi:MAG: zinc-ribbon domain-containing protein [Lachnospiraceae bacterium]|nr:zinc-ribbon domain-containing protein [Lachnospiraceae bacterium]MCI1656011.1 zinc-ribbon domain-containing protein [Lachnospiraceae bacterium]MCI2194493.1 zinc-ribbon domain-containing protein [Lachnospiraceae bacterium]
MAFMDRVGSAISSLADKGVSKTKELKDTAKYTMDIKNTENAISQAYREIGKAYYEAHKADAETEFEQIGEISELLEELQQLKAKRDEVRGVMKCPNCGAQVKESDRFCTSCGVKLEKPAERVEAEIVSHGTYGEPETAEEVEGLDAETAETAEPETEQAADAASSKTEQAADSAEPAAEQAGNSADPAADAVETAEPEAADNPKL